MRLLIQRVKHASVSVRGEVVSRIGEGVLALVGFGAYDPAGLPEDKAWAAMLNKVLDLRIFPDEEGKLNLSLRQTGGEILLVSQFTLYADCRRGRRPSFHPAAPPDVASRLFSRLVSDMGAMWPDKVGAGVFGEEMDVEFLNWGPVTIMLDSDELQPAGTGT